MECTGTEDAIRRSFKGFSGSYAVFFSKKKFSLLVYDRNLKVVAAYKAGYGKNPDGKAKLFEGDNRTPEGIYRVNEILSMDADSKSEAYKILYDMNRVFFRAKDGHSKWGRPTVDQGDNAYGPRYFGLDYPNSDDHKRYNRLQKKDMIPVIKGKQAGIGFGIAIHGNNDEEGIGQKSSSGCIRLYNSDIIDLERFIIMGTPVIISSE
jgi:murein L,D-transpeptidase YafK